jgi:tetratricopeptide (TPR) repeat protein
VAESFAWLADARRAVGNYPGAIDARRRGIAVLEQLLAGSPNVDYQSRLIAAHRTLGRFYADRGENQLAIEQMRAAVDEAVALIPKEPANTQWLDYSSWARLGLAREMLLAGNNEEAAAQTANACAAFQSLLRRNAAKADWRSGAAECWSTRARISVALGAVEQALAEAQAAVDASKAVRAPDPVANGHLIARNYRLLGDIQRQAGAAEAAREAWNNALAALPRGAAEQPDELAERAVILQRLGRQSEAQPLTARLASIGYRAPA